MSEVTEAEIIAIVKGYLLSSPPGEFSEVVTDVRGLLNNDELLSKNAADTFRNYNTDQMVQVIVPGTEREALITKYGELSPNEYLDPLGGNVLTYDHIKQKVTNVRPISAGELDSSAEPFRRALEEATIEYASQHYENGTPAVFSSSEGSEFKFYICISSSKFNPNNYWNGRWRTIWTVQFKPGTQAKLEAQIKIQVHYYEDGNVQLTANYNKKLSVNTTTNAKTTAEGILKQILKTEQEYHAALEQSFLTMGETTFKALRRNLPITREKIKWEAIRNYRIGGDIGGK
jgi:capping protein alpha